jgi:hypothetical protein
LVTKEFGPVAVTATVHFDLSHERLRFVVPFREIQGAVGWAAKPILKLFWNGIEVKLESAIAEQLSARGMPWDMVWVDHSRDPEGHRVATINVSPVILNDWLQHQQAVPGLAPRLASMAIAHDAVTIRVQLVPWVRDTTAMVAERQAFGDQPAEPDRPAPPPLPASQALPELVTAEPPGTEPLGAETPSGNPAPTTPVSGVSLVDHGDEHGGRFD